MKRRIVLTTLLTVGALSLAVTAAQQPAAGAAAQTAPKVVEVEKLRDNLFMLKGGGGNTAVFVGAAGVVVVDTKNPGWGQPILDRIKELTPKPITTIINTHTHGDHVSGNVEFPATVEVIVHENTAANMQEMRASTQTAPNGQPPNIFKANNGRGMPKKSFKDRMTIGIGADRIDLYYFGRGHTNGDAWVVFPSLRVVHAGDIFAGKQVPLVDFMNGGSGKEYGNTLAKAAAGLKGVDTIITGHSDKTMTMADLRQYAAFNKAFVAWAASEMKAGKSAEQAAAEYKVPAAYKGYTAELPPFFGGMKGYIQGIYDELKK